MGTVDKYIDSILKMGRWGLWWKQLLDFDEEIFCQGIGHELWYIQCCEFGNDLWWILQCVLIFDL